VLGSISQIVQYGLPAMQFPSPLSAATVHQQQALLLQLMGAAAAGGGLPQNPVISGLLTAQAATLAGVSPEVRNALQQRQQEQIQVIIAQMNAAAGGGLLQKGMAAPAIEALNHHPSRQQTVNPGDGRELVKDTDDKDDKDDKDASGIPPPLPLLGIADKNTTEDGAGLVTEVECMDTSNGIVADEDAGEAVVALTDPGGDGD